MTKRWPRRFCIRTSITDTPYGHFNLGTVSSLAAITLDDVKKFYRTHYSQSNVILGLAGGYSPAFLEGMKKDFRVAASGRRLPAASQTAGADRIQPRRYRR